MPWYIKTEKFKLATEKLQPNQRRKYLDMHHEWVAKLQLSGVKVSSGYLVDENQNPGGGGLLILEAASFKKAKELVKEDPMITFGLVNWHLEEWKIVQENILQ